jgi:hypothetical protein
MNIMATIILRRPKKKPSIVPPGKHPGAFTKSDIKTGKDDLDQETRELELEVTLGINDEKGKPHKVAKGYNLLGRGGALLGADLASWKGRELTPEELDGFDPETLKGQAVVVEIEKYRKDGTKRVPVIKAFHPATTT